MKFTENVPFTCKPYEKLSKRSQPTLLKTNSPHNTDYTYSLNRSLLGWLACLLTHHNTTDQLHLYTRTYPHTIHTYYYYYFKHTTSLKTTQPFERKRRQRQQQHDREEEEEESINI